MSSLTTTLSHFSLHTLVFLFLNCILLQYWFDSVYKRHTKSLFLYLTKVSFDCICNDRKLIRYKLNAINEYSLRFPDHYFGPLVHIGPRCERNATICFSRFDWHFFVRCSFICISLYHSENENEIFLLSCYFVRCADDIGSKTTLELVKT